MAREPRARDPRKTIKSQIFKKRIILFIKKFGIAGNFDFANSELSFYLI